MSGGKLLTPQEQIEHLKERGISFFLYSEEDTLIFIQFLKPVPEVARIRSSQVWEVGSIPIAHSIRK